MRVEIGLEGHSSVANLNSIGRGLNGFGMAFAELKPEIVVLLGDRFELFAPAIAALMLQIPIAHIHGGEVTEGAIDDSVRHAITKMASLHFPATEVYRRRIVQMGEDPDRVFNFGAPGLDQIYRSPVLSRSQLEDELGFSLEGPVGLVTYHPVTRTFSWGHRSDPVLGRSNQEERNQSSIYNGECRCSGLADK